MPPMACAKLVWQEMERDGKNSVDIPLLRRLTITAGSHYTSIDLSYLIFNLLGFSQAVLATCV